MEATRHEMHMSMLGLKHETREHVWHKTRKAQDTRHESM